MEYTSLNSNKIAQNKSQWFLSGQVCETDPVREIPLHSAVFSIGRRTGSSLCLDAGCISSNHAEFILGADSLTLRDLGSTNGTFVNGHRLDGEIKIQNGDLIQFATLVFRVGKKTAERIESHTIAEETNDRALTMMQFERLINDREVIPYYQPLVSLHDRKTFGYEILGRSTLYGLQSPNEMFLAASQLNVEAKLSEVFRQRGLEIGRKLPYEYNFFVNTHPKELGQPRLYDSLKHLRELDPKRLITLEIHEAATTNLAMMKRLRVVLEDLDIRLAFDDFGVGRARLVELSEVRPDYLKFDMKLTQNIESAPESRQEGVALFAKMVKDLGIKTLAEGVETEACHKILLEMGFDFAQGFLYCKPRPIDRFDAAGNEIK